MAMAQDSQTDWRIGENVPWSVSWTGEAGFSLRPSRDFPGLTDLVQRRHPGQKVALGWVDTSGKQQSATIEFASGPAG